MFLGPQNEGVYPIARFSPTFRVIADRASDRASFLRLRSRNGNEPPAPIHKNYENYVSTAFRKSPGLVCVGVAPRFLEPAVHHAGVEPNDSRLPDANPLILSGTFHRGAAGIERYACGSPRL